MQPSQSNPIRLNPLRISLRDKHFIPPSPRSLSIIDRACNMIDFITQRLEAHDCHMAATIPMLDEVHSTLSSIYSEQELQLLQSNGLIQPTENGGLATNNLRYVPMLDRVLDKHFESEQQNLTAIESTIKHFANGNIALRLLRTEILAGINKTWKQSHGIYRPENNGLYPIRDTSGKTIGIVSISPESEGSSTGRTYSCEQVKPFIRKVITAQARSALYERLVCRALEHSDIQQVGDELLLGQNAVFAKEDIRAGTCIGVYGGTLITKDDLVYAADDTYASGSTHINGQEILIDGDTIISRINTTFKIENGVPVAQAPSEAYNIDSAKFAVVLEDGRKINLSAWFTKTTIPAGKELRVSYGYSSELVNKLMQRQRSVV